VGEWLTTREHAALTQGVAPRARAEQQCVTRTEGSTIGVPVHQERARDLLAPCGYW